VYSPHLDIDECELFHNSQAGKLCLHACVNTPGGYRCSCPIGYNVTRDGRSCKGRCVFLCILICYHFSFSSCQIITKYPVMPLTGQGPNVKWVRRHPAGNDTYIRQWSWVWCNDVFNNFSLYVLLYLCFLKDIDECATRQNNCTKDQTCINTYGGFQCVRVDCPKIPNAAYVKTSSMWASWIIFFIFAPKSDFHLTV